MGKLAAAALVGLAGLLGYIQIAFGHVDPIMVGMSLLALALAGIVITGWRWGPLPGAVVFGLLSGLLATGAGEIAFALTNPSDFRQFSVVVVVLPLLAVGLVSSIWATAQNYRSGERGAPHGIPFVLTGLVGVVVGALLVASVAKSGTGAGVSPETLAGLPPVTIESFKNGTIRVKAGDTVAFRLQNTDPVTHQFDVDELGIHAPMPPNQDSLALFKATAPGTYTFYCTPHYNKATGEGMRGTLIVE
jgi:plastocyanin